MIYITGAWQVGLDGIRKEVEYFNFFHSEFIRVNGGFRYLADAIHGFDFTTSKEVRWPINYEKILGLGVEPSTGRGVVVKHTAKTAQLHKYIEVLKSEDSNEDGYKLSVFGHGGSCVILQDWNGGYSGYADSVFTLYDLLIFMCRKTKTNLMQSDTIHFGGKGLPWDVLLGLDHSAEADRFYTKMWIEACGRV